MRDTFSARRPSYRFARSRTWRLSMAIRIGDIFELPSGRVVRVACARAHSRPWHAVGANADARVCRAHADTELPGVEFYLDEDLGRPMVLDEEDAKVLVPILNQVRRLGSARGAR
jgi:hypothetical protein